MPGRCGWSPSGAAAFLAVIWPLTLAVVADAVFWLVPLLGYATIGLVVNLRRPPREHFSP